MKNVIKVIYSLIKALPLIAELLEMFTNTKKDSVGSPVRKSDKDIIDNV